LFDVLFGIGETYIDEVLYMYCVTTTTVSDKGFTFINNVL